MITIVVGTLGVVGLLTFPTMTEAAVAPLVYIAIVTVEGHFVTPMVIGHRLTLNPFAVFLAIAFCTWLWGPIGAFLAVPLLMALTVATGFVVDDAIVVVENVMRNIEAGMSVLEATFTGAREIGFTGSRDSTSISCLRSVIADLCNGLQTVPTAPAGNSS